MSCDPCASPIVVNLPGPQGISGVDGADGADGANAFTFITAGLNMPGEGASDNFFVMDSSWAAVGQNVTVAFAGEFEVMSKPNSLTLVLKNLKDSLNSAYMGNINPGLLISNGAQVSPSGKQGVPGVVPAGVAPDSASYIVRVADAGLPQAQAIGAIAPSGILKFTTGTGLLARATPGTDFLDPATGVEVADIGVTVQAKHVNLDALSGLAGVNNTVAYFSGAGALSLVGLSAFIRTFLDDANANIARLTLGVRYGLLGSVAGLELNPAGVPPMDLPAIVINSTRYIVDRVLATDASISITMATLGLFGSAGGGVPTICAIQSLATLTSSIKQRALTISAEGSTDIITSATLIPRLGTAQGAAATVSLWVFGYDLS